MAFEGIKKQEGGAVQGGTQEVHPRQASYDRVRAALGDSAYSLSQAKYKQADKHGNPSADDYYDKYKHKDGLTPLREQGTRHYWESTAAISRALLEAAQLANDTLDKLEEARKKFGFFTRGVEVPTVTIKAGDFLAPNSSGQYVEVPLLLDGPTQKRTKEEVQEIIDSLYAVLRKIKSNEFFVKRGISNNFSLGQDAYEKIGDEKLPRDIRAKASEYIDTMKALQQVLKKRFGSKQGLSDNVSLDSSDI